MPQMGESIAEGTVSKWLKQVGDKVERDEPILEISTDKVDAEIPSPQSGTLVEVRIQEGETVEVGTIVALIDTEGGAPAVAEPAEMAEPAPAMPPIAADQTPAPDAEPRTFSECSGSVRRRGPPVGGGPLADEVHSGGQAHRRGARNRHP